jgi:hypothetical protein
MSHQHTQFLATDRIACLTAEADHARLVAEARSTGGSRPMPVRGLGAAGIRIATTLRLALPFLRQAHRTALRETTR